MDIRPGDVFAVYSGSWIARAINCFQWIWSRDGSARYNHAGIILDESGRTFEALATLRTSHLDEYQDKPVIIARPERASGPKREAVLKQIIIRFESKWYPAWRLLLHIFGPLSKVSFAGRPVCSELVAFYLWQVGARHDQWAGTSPDTLVDEWRNWHGYQIVYEGKWVCGDK